MSILLNEVETKIGKFHTEIVNIGLVDNILNKR